ncbi:MAG: tRNA lysidine(34) synthetase TilS [Ruminococcaceae bacterium]|nr:tRNA lysidine(34) synthetase TilS [Oscillospiraceae bacterium]
MHPFEMRTAQYITDHQMAQTGSTILAGVSGGADSVAMLCALRALGFSLMVVHIHHGLRGAEADTDEQFVRNLCSTLQLPYFCEHFDVAKEAKKRGISIETAGREIRYTCFEKLRQKHHADCIAVAHTVDDNAETVLFHLTRGCALDGLCGIPPVNGRVIRPLLSCTRSEVEDYLKDIGMSFVTDSSNHELEYTRNRIRHLVLPNLKEINPAVSERIAQNTVSLSDDRAFLTEQTQALFEQCVTRDEGRIVVDLHHFSSAHVALQRRLILLVASLFDGCNLSFSQIEAVRTLSGTGKGLDLPADVRVTLSYHSLIWENSRLEISVFCHEITSDKVFIPEIKQTVVFDRNHLSPAQDAVFLDAQKLEGKSLFVRNRRKGDRFSPSGMKGTKKLQDFFVDKKIPADKRNAIPLLIADGEIAAVLGHRASSRFCADNNTIQKIKIIISGGNQ